MKTSTSMLDLFLMLLIMTIVLWVLSTLLINTADNAPESPEPQAFFIMEVTWEQVANDVDVWGMRVGDKDSICGYNRREGNILVLSNDHTSRNYGMVDGQFLTKATEQITMNHIHPGEYAFSLHGYAIRETPNTAHVKLMSTRPYKVLYEKDIDVGAGEEHHICRMKIDKDGDVLDVFDNLPIQILRGGHVH